MTGRRTPEEVTISRLRSWVFKNRDVLDMAERGIVYMTIELLEGVDPDLRRAGRDLGAGR